MVESSNKQGGKKYQQSGLEIRIGKKMSYLLRHGAQESGITISSDGYVLMDDLLDYLGPKVGIDLVYSIVENNDKKRYELKM